MEYEVVELSEKTVVGITERTRNDDEKMPEVIGGLWQRFYAEGIYQSIENKKNSYSLGLYSQYESDANGAYDITVCCEVDKSENPPPGTEVKTIPAGKYAKFIVKGPVQTVVYEFWQKLWSMDLDRKCSYDFEEYLNDDMEKGEVHIYIAIH